MLHRTKIFSRIY